MSTPTPEPTASAAEARTGDVRLLIEQVVKAIVDSPDEVIVEEVKRTGNSLELELEVAQKDIGKVIGKQGRTIRSLRTLAQAAGIVQNLRCNLELLEEDEDEGVAQGPQAGNVNAGTHEDGAAEPDDDDNIGNRA
ncbi:MAG TPA: KH domain-containing protein [Terriglobales bacterium]|nr:KH domain-containing protein [Terriglobales bacterium]